METILSFLMIAALAGIPIGLFSAIVKKIRKKPAKKSLASAGISFLVLIATVVIFPTDSDGRQDAEEEEASADTADDEPDDSSDVDIEPEPEENPDAVAGSGEDENDSVEYIGDDISLDDISSEEHEDFSESRVFVEYYDALITETEIDDAIEMIQGDEDEKAEYLAQYWDDFSEGTHRAALIDTEGKIIWKSEHTCNDTVLDEVSEFKDGLAYFIFNGNDGCSYSIIDSDGNVTFTRDIAESYYDRDYMILTHGGGQFLAVEHTADFDTDEWRLGAIDKNGEIVMPFQVYEMMPSPGPEPVKAPSGDAPDPDVDYWGYLEYQEQLEAYEEYVNYNNTPEDLSFDFQANDYSCEYRGENIFEIESNGDNEFYVLINTEMQKVIYSYSPCQEYAESGEYTFLTDFEDGTADVLYCDSMGDTYISSIGTDGTVGQATPADWLTNSQFKEISDGMVFISDSFASGSYLDIDRDLAGGAYYNIAGEKVIEFPEYQDKNPYFGSSFHGGHALLFLEGMDGSLYITVIDKKGEKMFEPAPLGDYDMAYLSEDGKYLITVGNGQIAISDTNKKELASIECADISGEKEYNVYDGMIRMEDVYINVEDGTVIGAHGKGLSVALH